MEIKTSSNNNQIVKMTRQEWQEIGKKAGWVKEAGAIMSLPATISAYNGGIPAGSSFNFLLGMEVEGHEITINPTPEFQFLYQLMQGKIKSQKTAAPAAAAPAAAPAAPAAASTPKV